MVTYLPKQGQEKVSTTERNLSPSESQLGLFSHSQHCQALNKQSRFSDPIHRVIPLKYSQRGIQQITSEWERYRTHNGLEFYQLRNRESRNSNPGHVQKSLN